MQKIVLSQATLGLLIGRLKNFFAGDVIENEYDDVMTPEKIAKRPFNLDGDHWWIAMVTRHWQLNDEFILRRGEPRPMIHVSHSIMNATFFKEGDEFYFFGNRNIVVRRVNSSTKWNVHGQCIPSISRFMLVRSRHKLMSHELETKKQSLEDAYQFNQMVVDDTRQDMDASLEDYLRQVDQLPLERRLTKREIGFTGDFMTMDDLG